MKNWYVVYTQPNGEGRALMNLRRQGFSAYLPMFRRRRVHARRADIVERPLFARYLFVALDPALDRWRAILGTFGVCDLVRRGETPSPVPAGIVEALQTGDSARAFDEVDPAAGLRLGDNVRILAGPFADLIARFQALADVDRIVVLLDLLGREVRVKIPTRAIATA